MKRSIQACGVAVALLAALLLSGCNKEKVDISSSPESAAATAEPTPPAEPVANPLTGAADADYTNRRPVAVTLWLKELCRRPSCGESSSGSASM